MLKNPSIDALHQHKLQITTRNWFYIAGKHSSGVAQFEMSVLHVELLHDVVVQHLCAVAIPLSHSMTLCAMALRAAAMVVRHLSIVQQSTPLGVGVLSAIVSIFAAVTVV
ncbi:Hypothetical predicted protein [Olea europaea subsp. europaea]|uniref:Uncharacterized protein n=1 Tax=Olea europaea subsp. europaea TaxID=158383 RepID=A0A8S0S9B4_OLEEU|nr:Hypothetical predicted protein [Olea europaea subsp. europaea]